MSFNPIGPEWWQTTYGFTSIVDFRAKCGPLLDPLYSTWLGHVDDALLLLAWNSPTSVQGLYLSAVLTAQGFHEENPSGPATVTANSLTPLVINGLQGQVLDVPGLVIANCFQVTIQGVAGGRAVDNVVGVENASGTAAGAAAAVKAAWEVASGPLSQLANLYSVPNYHAVDLSSSSGTIADLASTGVGARATSFSTRGAAALIKWNGSSRSRTTRGRLYFGPLAEVDINSDGATLTSGQITAFGTAFTNFRNSLATAGYPLVVLSRKTSTATIVSSQAVEATIATQRRRIRS